MAISVLFAIKNAVNSFRRDARLTDWWNLGESDHILLAAFIVFHVSDGPATVEKIQQSALINKDQMIF